MESLQYYLDTSLYAQCIEDSKRKRWDIDKDVFRGRDFDFSMKFLPDGISKVDELDFLTDREKKLLSQIQGRTYANMFGFVERFIRAKILEICRDHWMDDLVALEALVRSCDEGLKHQELFCRIEEMMAPRMPDGYRFLPDPNDAAVAVLEKSTWAVLALTYGIELLTQEHYIQSMESDDNLSPLYKDIFLFHWKEESHHVVMGELEWSRHDAQLTVVERDQAINELIDLIRSVDGILQSQVKADLHYFLDLACRSFSKSHVNCIKTGLLTAYRWQYIFSGMDHPRFEKVLFSLITETQGRRISRALTPLLS
jgi:hypothetical protein